MPQPTGLLVLIALAAVGCQKQPTEAEWKAAAQTKMMQVYLQDEQKRYAYHADQGSLVVDINHDGIADARRQKKDGQSDSSISIRTADGFLDVMPVTGGHQPEFALQLDEKRRVHYTFTESTGLFSQLYTTTRVSSTENDF